LSSYIIIRVCSRELSEYVDMITLENEGDSNENEKTNKQKSEHLKAKTKTSILILSSFHQFSDTQVRIDTLNLICNISYILIGCTASNTRGHIVSNLC
jgi:hypothetical protein